VLYGYGGKILRVDLTTGAIRVDETQPALAEKFLGGRGFGIHYLLTELPRGTDPLGPDNMLIVSAGALSGTLVPGAGKTDIACKSPLTGDYAGANVGGLLSAEMRFAGYDAIIITGQSPRPVYLYIENDRVELRDAGDLWGKGSMAAEEVLKRRLGEEFQIAIIGPGGEHLVKYACVSANLRPIVGGG
jgi:aldehyde:ferredoxin oxidoreductase